MGSAASAFSSSSEDYESYSSSVLGKKRGSFNCRCLTLITFDIADFRTNGVSLLTASLHIVSLCFGSTFQTRWHLCRRNASTNRLCTFMHVKMHTNINFDRYRLGSCKLSDLVISPISPQRMFWVTRLQIGHLMLWSSLTNFCVSQCPSSIHHWNPPVPACTHQIHRYKLRGYSGGRIFDVWHATELQKDPEDRCFSFLCQSGD